MAKPKSAATESEISRDRLAQLLNEDEYLRRRENFRGTDSVRETWKRVRGSIPESNPLTDAEILGSSGMVTRPFCNRTNRANESIPSLRHRAKTTPQEQSIRFPLLYLTCWRKLD